MTPLNIYLWQQADNLAETFKGVAIALSIVTAVIFVFGGITETATVVKRTLRIAPWILAPLWLIVAILPSSKTIALMVALPAIANSEPIQKDLPELYKLAVEALKEQISK